MNLQRLYLFVFLLASHLAEAQQKNLHDLIFQKGRLEGATVGMYAIDISTGESILDVNGQQSLIPASIQKLFTTGAAWKVLGPEYQFKTFFWADGPIVDSVLQGDLVVYGNNDPTLGAAYREGVLNMESLAERWLETIKNKGIKAVKGSIVVNGSYLPKAPVSPTWLWEDLGNYYGAGPFGLNIHENYFTVKVRKSNTQGALAQVESTFPTIPYMVLSNDLRMGDKNDDWIYGDPLASSRQITGTISRGSGTRNIKGSIPDPAWVLTKYLEEKWLTAGVILSDSASFSYRPYYPHEQGMLLDVVSSPPLKDIIQWTNQKSINVFAESLLRQISKYQGSDGSLKNSLSYLRTQIEMAGIDSKTLFLEDGSGLSARNGCTAMQMTQWLAYMAKEDTLFVPFRERLAEAGNSGTLESRYKNSPLRGRMYAKTGTMTRVQSLAGYVQAKNGHWIAFTIMVNNSSYSGSSVRNWMEDWLEELAR